MRVVMVTQNSPIQAYFANRMAQAHQLEAIFIENAWQGLWRRYKTKLRKHIAIHGLLSLPMQLIEGGYLYYNQRLTRKTELDFFFPHTSDISFDSRIPQFNIRTVNDGDAVKKLKEIQPDVIAVYGASILRKRVIGIPKYGVLNLHNGILPQYRGPKSEFWALYNNEPHMIGATVHYIDEKIDTGDIVMQTAVTPLPGEDERQLRCRTTQAGLEMMIKAIEQMGDGTITATPQDCSIANYYSTPSMQAYRQVHKQIRKHRRLLK